MLRLYDAKRLYVQDKWETYFSSIPYCLYDKEQCVFVLSCYPPLLCTSPIILDTQQKLL